MMFDDLLQLAQESSSATRDKLLTRIASLFVKFADRHSDRELALFGEVMLKLVAAAGLETRLDLSRKLAPISVSPAALVLLLSRDEPAIAKPVLTRSLVLSPSELKQIAIEETLGHRAAIALRPGIGTEITDILIKLEEQAVLQGVSSNLRADISDWGFDHLAAKSSSDKVILENLSARPDISLDAALAIMPLLSPVARHRLASLIAGDDAEIDERIIEVTMKANKKKGLPAVNTIRVEQLTAQIKSGKRKLDDVCRFLASENRPRDLALVLSTFSGLPENEVSHAVNKVNGETLAIYCRSLELSAKTFMLIADMWSRRLNLPGSHRQRIVERFEQLDPSEALNSVRKLRPVNRRVVA